MRNVLMRYTKAWAILLILFMASTTLVCSLPNDKLKDNVVESISNIWETLRWDRTGTLTNYFDEEFSDNIDLRFYYDNTAVSSKTTIDSWMDAFMLAQMELIDRAEPFRSAMTNPIHQTGVDEYTVIGIERLAPNSSYGRYWNGWMVLYRPIWMFATYQQGRLFLLTLLLFGIVFVCKFLFDKLGTGSVVAFLLSLCSIGLPVVFMNYENFTCFFVMFVAIMVMITKFKDAEFIKKIPIFMFCVGACTSFFDLLTSPLITFGVPFIFALLFIIKKEWLSLKQQFVLFIKSGVAWVSGYGLLWASKWVITDVFFRMETIKTAVRKVAERMGGVGAVGKEIVPFSSAVWRPFNVMFSGITGIIAMNAIILWVAMLIYTRVKNPGFVFRQVKKYALLPLIAIMPYVWFMLMRNHTGIHYFVYPFRQQMITVFAILMFMFQTVSLKRKGRK